MEEVDEQRRVRVDRDKFLVIIILRGQIITCEPAEILLNQGPSSTGYLSKNDDIGFPTIPVVRSSASPLATGRLKLPCLWFGLPPPDWTAQVKATHALFQRGDSINQMMQVTGEEGVTLEDFVTWQKSLFVDMVYLQQDGFDPVDAAVPIERQKEYFGMLRDVIQRDYHFKNKEQARDFFTRLTGLFKNLNYALPGTPDYDDLLKQIEELEQNYYTATPATAGTRE
ncbi:MAG: hypothetical protein ACR2NP_03935 [Pirellulaceae bacterium]